MVLNVTYYGVNAIGNEIITVDYPCGKERQFSRQNAADQFLTPSQSWEEDRIQQSSTDPNGTDLSEFWAVSVRRDKHLTAGFCEEVVVFRSSLFCSWFDAIRTEG